MESQIDVSNLERYGGLAQRLRDEDRVEPFRFVGAASEAEIARGEAALAVALPPSFRWFLREFGATEIRSEIYGLGAQCPRTIMQATAEQRSRTGRRLPAGFVVFAESSQWVGPLRWAPCYVCLDTSRSLEGEYPVVRWCPEAKRRDRLQQSSGSFLDWLEEELNAVDQFLSPPRDWRNADAWERYWQRVIADPRERAANSCSFASSAIIQHLPLLRERRLQRILLAGNGIALDPHFFVHCGFDVHALDVSPSACRHVAEVRVDADNLIRYTAEYDEPDTCDSYGMRVSRFNPARSRERLEQERRPGGQLAVIDADLFEYSPQQLYGVIYSDRAWQGFADEDREALVRRFFQWLSPGGVCLVGTVNLYGNQTEAEQPFRDAGFFVHLDATNEWYRAQSRQPWRWRKSGPFWAEYERRAAAGRIIESSRLDGGEKMVIFWHGSG